MIVEDEDMKTNTWNPSWHRIPVTILDPVFSVASCMLRSPPFSFMYLSVSLHKIHISQHQFPSAQ